MKESKVQMIEQAKAIFKERLHLFEEKANGHFRINGCDFWATTGKWWDPKKCKKGVGLKSFIEHIESI